MHTRLRLAEALAAVLVREDQVGRLSGGTSATLDEPSQGRHLETTSPSRELIDGLVSAFRMPQRHPNSGGVRTLWCCAAMSREHVGAFWSAPQPGVR